MKKAIGMFVALILALGMTGVAFAHWSETLKINGIVNTGELDAEWSVGESWDTDDPYDPEGNPLAPEGKDVSSIKCWVDMDDPHKLWVVVVNAYPSIDYYQKIDLHNSGTIPLHIKSISIDFLPPEGEVNVNIDMPAWESTQLEPSEVVYGLIHVHVKQEAAELATYEFEVTVEVEQWNA